MSEPVGTCSSVVAGLIPNLGPEEKALVDVMCLHGRSPKDIVKRIKALRWMDIQHELGRALVDPPMTQAERQHAHVLHGKGWGLADILAAILKGRELQPKPKASKSPRMG